jgi:hypothetical protein
MESPNSERYQDEMKNAFMGEGTIGRDHDWHKVLDQMRRYSGVASHTKHPTLSVWQAAGYKHAQKILNQQDLKGCLYWWTPGSGKSIMVALLIELLSRAGQKIIVVSTPQNKRENGLKQCIRSILQFSPR